MNKHASKIWHSWVDSIPVQFKESDDEGWKDAELVRVSFYRQPQNEPQSWRVKPPPRRVAVRYRVWLMKSGRSVLPTIHHIPSENDDPTKFETYALVEALDSFIRWDGPERVTEVEVEE